MVLGKTSSVMEPFLKQLISQDSPKLGMLILDVKGNLNLYQNKNTKTLFNLYNIDGIDKNYKDGELFTCK